MNTLESWENKFQKYLSDMKFLDSSHGLGHLKRVSRLATRFASADDDHLIILAASYFHDIVSYPKNDPRRSKSSLHASLKAEEILIKMQFPKEKIEAVKHCIEAHSFSAGVKPFLSEAKAVQDADRMEALGAIGLARTFYVAGIMGCELFSDEDPLGKERELDDSKYALDHFKIKLLKLPETMQTKRGKVEAIKRVEILLNFLKEIEQELFLNE